MDIQMDYHVNKNKYWFALSTAFFYGGKISCLSMFHDQRQFKGFPFDQRKLYKALVKIKPTLDKLYLQGALSQEEWYQIFPPVEQKTDSRKFEIGMLMALLHQFVIPPPSDGWLGRKAAGGDGSPTASIIRLRKLKDKLGGMKGMHAMSRDTFHREWRRLCDILYRLGFDVGRLAPIYDAAMAGESFNFQREHRREFHVPLKDAKIIFFKKILRDSRLFYTRHMKNVNTLVSIAEYGKVDYLHQQARSLKRPLKKLEQEYETLAYNNYKQPLKYLHDASRINQEILKNDVALDVEIERHNQAAEREDMRVRKRTFDTVNHKTRQQYQKTSDNSKTMQRAADVGWLRRNTMISVSSSTNRPSILPGAGENQVFRNAVNVGDY